MQKVSYLFTCEKCGEIILYLDPHNDNLREQHCPICGNIARRKYTANPVHYHGTGFHSTDYK